MAWSRSWKPRKGAAKVVAIGTGLNVCRLADAKVPTDINHLISAMRSVNTPPCPGGSQSHIVQGSSVSSP
eukprot:1378944-Amorphochlora_amoeboformis.AAC.1